MHTNALLPQLGMRYGPSGVWYLKQGSLFLESSNRLVKARVKQAGHTPRVPSLVAATRGLHLAYANGPTMGTDPEFFLKRGDEIEPAFAFLPDKHASMDGLFWDGFQAETTVRATGNLMDNIAVQMNLLGQKNLNVAPLSVWRIPPLMLKWASEAHVELGCDPSRNAYGSVGRKVEEPRLLNWRFAGGHEHFELYEEERQDKDGIRYLVKTLDALQTMPCVALAQNYDHFIRRRYYGLAGEYRLPPHGLEYRTLSNFWLMDPRVFGLVFDLGRHALNIGRTHMRSVVEGQERAIQDTINYCDVRSARDFMHLNKEFYSAWASMLYDSSKPFWEAIEGGVDKVIANWGVDVVGAWNYDKAPSWGDLI